MIKSEIIYLKKLMPNDLSFYQSIYINADLMRYVGPVLSKEATEKSFFQTLSIMSKKKPSMVLYVIHLTESKERLGVIGIRWNQGKKSAVEMGIIIKPSMHRFGYGHMAKSSLIAYSFNKLKIKSIVAICDEDNAAANLANKKLGFKKEQTYFDKKAQCMTVRWRINR
jgi:RimJ/RimL family protein N-acetyltransferase